jgi:predicted ArsR family transcriptional regulator
MRPTTRLLILDYLRKQQAASVNELSRSLNMTGANIRHHLAVLEANDLIEIISQRQDGRGRPVNVFCLSRRVLGDGLDGLAGAMIDVWSRNMPQPAQEAGLQAIARRLSGKSPSLLESPLPRRLTRMIDRLNELQYQARWEAGLHGPTIILGHCPYAAIIASYPELCCMDAYLLEDWTGLSIEQTHKLQTSTKGVPFCAFQVPTNQ